MAVPEGYAGPPLDILVRTSKPADNTAEVIVSLLAHVKEGAKVAIFQKDAIDGDVTEQTLKAVGARNLQRVDMKDFMDRVNMLKIAPELENLEVAGRFVKWTFENIVNEVEDIIDAEKEIKHTQIQGKVERMAEKADQVSKFLAQFPNKGAGIDNSLLEYPIAVLI
jgi:nucleosome binding factor SPN SPT16 subunit